METGWKTRLLDFFRREWLPCILVLILLAARLCALNELNATYSVGSDDISYMRSGIHLAKTGMLTMHERDIPTAQIMPGMSVLIAGFYLVLGEGNALWLGLKLFWVCMGALVGWFTYHSVRLYAPAWCAAAATLLLLRTDFIWADNLILTETPTMLCLSIMIYCTLQMGRTGKTRYAVGLGVFYLTAILFRANMAAYIVFAGIYLLCVKYGWRRLLKQGAVLALALLCFLTPWTIRNYHHFQAFIPLTFGAGNPVLLGTYQGEGYPLDEELDYQTNVDDVMRQRYAKYYNADGTVIHNSKKYLELEADGVKAAYRQRVWLERDPASFLRSYLILKPLHMMRGAFYWDRLWDISHNVLKDIQKWLLDLCVVILLTLPFRRENRSQLLFLALFYVGNVLLYCMGFSLDRFNIGLMPAMLVFLGIGVGSLGALWGRLWEKLAPRAA